MRHRNMELRPYYLQYGLFFFVQIYVCYPKTRYCGSYSFSDTHPRTRRMVLQEPQRFTCPFDKVREPLHALEACVFLRLMGMSFRHEQPCA